MVPTAHLLTGGAVGAAMPRRPLLVAGLAFASHLAFDALPHFDEAALFHPRTSPLLLALVLLDGAVGIGLLWWATRPRRGGASRAGGGDPPAGPRPWVFLGAFFAVLPDLLDNVPFWSPAVRRLPGMAAFHGLHAAVQWNVPREAWPLGIAAQVATIALAVWAIRRLGSGARDPQPGIGDWRPGTRL